MKNFGGAKSRWACGAVTVASFVFRIDDPLGGCGVSVPSGGRGPLQVPRHWRQVST